MYFLPDLTTFIGYSIASVILFLTPGPDMSLFLSRTIASGRSAGIASCVGANIGCVVHTLLAAFGVSALIAASHTGFLILKVVGAGYLLWLAFQALRHGSSLNVAEGQRKPVSVLNSFLMGVTVNLTNPKVVLFFITFLPQFVSADDPAAPGKLFFLGGEFALIYLPCCLLLVFAADRIALLLRTSRWVARVLNYGFAAVFTGFAVLILGARTQH